MLLFVRRMDLRTMSAVPSKFTYVRRFYFKPFPHFHEFRIQECVNLARFCLVLLIEIEIWMLNFEIRMKIAALDLNIHFHISYFMVFYNLKYTKKIK